MWEKAHTREERQDVLQRILRSHRERADAEHHRREARRHVGAQARHRRQRHGPGQARRVPAARPGRRAPRRGSPALITRRCLA